jgi:hypothetical protein
MRWLAVTVVSMGLMAEARADEAVPTHELAASSQLVLVYADRHEVDLGDAALVRTTIGVDVSPRLYLHGDLDVLALSEDGQEHAVQSAGLRASVRLDDRFSLSLAGEYGHMRGDGNHLGALELLAHAHFLPFPRLLVRTSAGLRGTQLFYEEAGDDRYYFAEAVASLRVLAPVRPRLNCWADLELGVPFFHRPEAYDDVIYLGLDPQLRLQLEVGISWTVSEHVAVLATVTQIARGNAIDEGSELPLLDGGFEQLQVGVGAAFRLPI